MKKNIIFYTSVKLPASCGSSILHYKSNGDEAGKYTQNTMALKDAGNFILPKKYSLTERKREGMNDKEYIEYLKSALKQYSKDLLEERNELKNGKILKMKLDYFKDDGIKYPSHASNIIKFFCMLLGKDTRNYDATYYKEYQWFKKCNNSGIIHLKEEGDYYNTFGYDFKMSYPTDMASSSFLMPTKKGEELRISALPEKLQYGIYRVKIESTDASFNKVFNYSKYNHYTHYSIERARVLSKKFKISINLICDGLPNALIYNDFVCGRDIFCNWYLRLTELKAAFPKSSIVKNLSSSCWGYLQKVQKTYFENDEIETEYELGKKFEYDENNITAETDYLVLKEEEFQTRTLYHCIDLKKPIYKMNFRLLPFITSFSRAKMMLLIDTHGLYDNIIRIQTDSITLDKEFNTQVINPRTKKPYSNLKTFCYDEKISGDLHFENVNNYWSINNDNIDVENDNVDVENDNY